MSSPRTVVLPSRKGSESARSIRRGLPPTSTLLRFLTAERAVSWSIGNGDCDSEAKREVNGSGQGRHEYPRIRRNHNLLVFRFPCRTPALAGASKTSEMVGECMRT